MTRRVLRPLTPSLVFAALALAPPARPAEHAENGEPRPTLVWIATQLVPSPEVAAGQGQAQFGLRWQATPVLYSFGVPPDLPPWRALVVEPLVRQSGSIELFFSPEVFFGTPVQGLLRGGVRAYFPLIAKGDDLSASIATSYTNVGGKSGVGYEVGVYTLYGVFGLTLTFAPEATPLQWITTLRFRYF